MAHCWRGAHWGIVLLLGATVSACSSADGWRGDASGTLVVSPPPITAIPQIDRTEGLVLPIEAYRMNAEQRKLLARARAILVDQCMRPFGFRRALQASDGNSNLTPMTRRYGVTDPAIAAEWGYHLAPGQGTVDRKEKGPIVSPAELLVWAGSESGQPLPQGQAPPTYNGLQVPAGGCAGEASRKLALDERDGLGESLTTSIDFDGFTQAKSDPRVVDVFAKWSTCMRPKGYNYRDPLAAAGAADMTSQSPSATEIQTALADVICKSENNVVGVWFAVESAYQSVMIQQSIQELDVIKAKINEVLQNAAAVVNNG